MRVLILGPVCYGTNTGGVAVFDESLYDGFKLLRDEVQILSISRSNKIDNIVIGNGKIKPNAIFFHTSKISKEIKKFNPDLVISSLQYSAGIKRYKKYCKKAIFIHVLHGYPCPINSKLKAFVINKLAKYSKKYFDYVTTVSYASYAINKQINGVECDKIIPNSINIKYSESIPSSKDFDFLYIGRLHKDKNIELIADALILLKEKYPNLKIAFGGYGDLESLFLTGKYKKSVSGFDFLGKIDHDDVSEYMQKSKFFISLAPNEAFGIVFAEAISNGCNVIMPITSGIVPLLYDKEYFHCTEAICSRELSISLEQIFKKYSQISDGERKDFFNSLSNDCVASAYKQLIECDNGRK